MNVIGQIKELRILKRVSFKELSEATGYPMSYFAKAEQNDVIPDSNYLNMVCNVMNVDLSELINEAIGNSHSKLH